jgi:hypothetical protein
VVFEKSPDPLYAIILSLQNPPAAWIFATLNYDGREFWVGRKFNQVGPLVTCCSHI